MKLKTIIAGLALTAIGFSAFANETHEAREDAMKKAGGAIGVIAKMTKGEVAFDQDALKVALTNLVEVGNTFPDHFGPGTENADSEALPAIWENMDDFKARAAKLASDAEMQLTQLPTDQAGMAAVMGAIGPNCGGCHEKYRMKKQ